MFYLIGIGLNENGISLEGKEIAASCKKVYLESFTVSFPYPLKDLEKVIGKKIISLRRLEVESKFLVNEAKKQDIALLVYGNPLFATTHISLLEDCRHEKIATKIVYAAGIFDAIAETGLQLYKFGKIASLPKWDKDFTPKSFLDYVLDNKKINAHSLILVDIGLEYKDALIQLKECCIEKNITTEIIVCSRLGTEDSLILFGTVEKLMKEKVKEPFCFIIPGTLHFLEEQVSKRYRIE